MLERAECAKQRKNKHLSLMYYFHGGGYFYFSLVLITVVA